MRIPLSLVATLLAGFGCSFDWERYTDQRAGNDTTCATGVSDLRVSRLARGIDLYGWLREDAPPDDFIHARELEEFSRMGFTFVRASFYAPLLFDPAQPDQINEANLGLLTQAMASAQRAKLGMVFAPYFTPEFKQRLGAPETRDVALDALLRMWGRLATFLDGTDPDWAFLELMGAPDFADHREWNAILTALLRRVRAAAPKHTIIADANSGSLRVNWASMTAMANLEPVAGERNVIYGFIFFDPVIFSHQGATWRSEWPELSAVRNLPYPSSPALVASALGEDSESAARADIETYGRESFGPELLSLGLDKVAAWSEANCARVMCVEFGAHRAVAPADSVARWVKDVRTLLEARRMGWSYWSYRERMGIAAPQPGPVIDLQVGNALGLTP